MKTHSVYISLNLMLSRSKFSVQDSRFKIQDLRFKIFSSLVKLELSIKNLETVDKISIIGNHFQILNFELNLES